LTQDELDMQCKDGELQHFQMNWKAVDDCGNSAEYTIYIVIKDDTAPEFIEFEPIICGNQSDPLDGIKVVDNYPVVHTYFKDKTIHDNCLGLDIIERTFYAVDICGNTTTKKQHVYP